MQNLEDENAILPRWKVEKMMEDKMNELYDEKVLPLHRETSGRLDGVFTIINKVDGGVTVMKWIGGVFGFTLVILNIIAVVSLLKAKL